jgi:hypothetical protein
MRGYTPRLLLNNKTTLVMKAARNQFLLCTVEIAAHLHQAPALGGVAFHLTTTTTTTTGRRNEPATTRNNHAIDDHHDNAVFSGIPCCFPYHYIFLLIRGLSYGNIAIFISP